MPSGLKVFRLAVRGVVSAESSTVMVLTFVVAAVLLKLGEFAMFRSPWMPAAMPKVGLTWPPFGAEWFGQHFPACRDLPYTQREVLS
jgi:hypothetical protein